VVLVRGDLRRRPQPVRQCVRRVCQEEREAAGGAQDQTTHGAADADQEGQRNVGEQPAGPEWCGHKIAGAEFA